MGGLERAREGGGVREREGGGGGGGKAKGRLYGVAGDVGAGPSLLSEGEVTSVVEPSVGRGNVYMDSTSFSLLTIAAFCRVTCERTPNVNVDFVTEATLHPPRMGLCSIEAQVLSIPRTNGSFAFRFKIRYESPRPGGGGGGGGKKWRRRGNF